MCTLERELEMPLTSLGIGSASLQRKRDDMSDALPEPVGAAYDVFKERLRCPIVGTYLLSYLVINWDMIIRIVCEFDRNNLDKSISEIQAQMVGSHYVYPILAAAVYILAIPYLQYLLFLYKQWITKKQERSAIEKDNELLEIRIVNEHGNMKLDTIAEFGALRMEIDLLKIKKDAIEKRWDRYKKAVSIISDEYRKVVDEVGKISSLVTGRAEADLTPEDVKKAIKVINKIYRLVQEQDRYIKHHDEMDKKEDSAIVEEIGIERKVQQVKTF